MERAYGQELKIVTLAACHNRCQLTLNSLADLHVQELTGGTRLEHVLVDDGSTDGTGESVRSRFPEVLVVEGGGSLYWAGGMRFGWERIANKYQYDFLFVYNDDVRLDSDALQVLLDAARPADDPHVVAGSFLSEDGTEVTYGGRRRSSRWHPLKFDEIVRPDGTIQQAVTLNMNGALISRGALELVGFLSDYFVHSAADYEYGLKLKKAGGEVLVAPSPIGRCQLNPISSAFPHDAPTLRDSMQRLFDMKREPFRQRFHYYRRHGGWLWPVLWLSPYLTIWPRYLKTKLSREAPAAGAR